MKATSRTWTAYHIDREVGVIVGLASYAVTIARTARGLIATVDGVQVPVLTADRILRTAARVEVVSEVLEAAPIGKSAIIAAAPRPTTAQRNLNARMTAEEAGRLAVKFKAQPYTSFYTSISETTGKQRSLAHADALYILTVRGLLGSVAA